MKDNKINTNKLKISKFVYLFVFFLCGILCINLGYRCLVNYQVGNITINKFIINRNINEEVLIPKRGSIYDSKGDILAQDVSNYTLIAYLDESRSKNSKILYHVKDKENTAKKLSELIDLDYDKILAILNKDAYQVEFGIAGKNLNQIKMEEIRNLKLPGIDFIKSTKRYYPNGDFASYLLGYTKNKEDKDGNVWMVGELGLEAYYNQELTGKTGYVKYEKDGKGNKIANSNEYKEEAVNGATINLTVDNNIQLFIENAVKSTQNDSQAEWVIMAIMNAKTGAILGYSSTPSFDPNIRNLTNYMDPFVSFAYEPGSTMKTFSYMCAIENGKYNGSDTFLSGSKTYVSELDKTDTVTIRDWNGSGWGVISFDRGFAMSSNIGVATLMEDVLTKQQFRDCLSKYGFGKKTGITLKQEVSGNVAFTYDIEAATAGYGQGITVTPIQMLQGLSIIANDGVMLSPYIVSTIVNDKGEKIISNSRTELGKVASSETITKMKSLLKSVIVDDSSIGTGAAYYMNDYDLIGKTGTASLYDYNTGRYLSGNSDYIYSFAGLYPGNDPEIIIYMAVKKPKDTYNYLANPVKNTVINVSKYLNIDSKKILNNGYMIDNYENKTVTDVKKILENNKIKVQILGTGNKVINQYPNDKTLLYSGDTIYLLTNDYEKTMIDLTGLSYKECKNVLDLMGVEYEFDGYGYVYEQNIKIGDKITEEVLLKLKGKY